jgi:hypothetical protein
MRGGLSGCALWVGNWVTVAALADNMSALLVDAKSLLYELKNVRFLKFVSRAGRQRQDIAQLSNILC